MNISIFDKVAVPSLFADYSIVEMEFADSKVKFISNDLDAYLYARGRLTDAQLAALSSQISQSSSVFDSMTDEQRVQFLSSRYSQNFASVDAFRQYLVDNMSSLEEVAAASDSVSDSSSVSDVSDS